MPWVSVILFGGGDAPVLLPIWRSFLSCERLGGDAPVLLPICRCLLSYEDNFESSVLILFKIPVIGLPKVFLVSSFKS